MADPAPLIIAYPPIKRIIKLEILEEQQVASIVQKENWTLQLPSDPVTMEERPIIAYPPIQQKIKLEFPDLNQQVNDDEEENWQLEGGERSEHSTLDNFEESYEPLADDSTDDVNINHSPKAGLCKEPKRQVETASHQKKKVNPTGWKKRREMPFKCTKCDSSYKRKRFLDHHMKYECGVPFQCALCKQNFATKCSLRNHLVVIHNIARHKLDKYGAGFKDRSIHPYKCDQYGRTYVGQGNLTRHVKTECGVNPSFDCPKCDKGFKHKADMKRHLIEIHKVEPSQLAALGLVRAVVLPENQFKCDRCGTSYTHKDSLKRHFRAGKCGK